MGLSENYIIQHLKQLQNARQPMLHSNSIQAPWDIEECICANESDEWSRKGCCPAEGKHYGTILGVKGVYSRIDTSAANTVDLGTALWRMEARGMLLITTRAMIKCARTPWPTLHQRNIHQR